MATPLFTVLVPGRVTDIIFAVDSIRPFSAVTQDPFLVFTSNAFAILVPAGDVLPARRPDPPVHLPQGRSRRVLVFVGVKMLLLDIYKVPIWLSLAVIANTITVAVGWSLRATRGP